MIETMQDFLKRIKVDAQRLFFLFVFVFALSFIDDIIPFKGSFSFIAAVLTSTSIVLAVAGLSHIVRRILFPSIDMREFAKRAIENPISASIVYLGVCIVLSTFVVVNVMLLA